jgi:FeS assembly SUF system regulator
LLSWGAGVIRLSRLADYGIVIVTHLARQPERQQAAPEIALATSIPQPVASKVLKLLARADVLVSHRGARGGYGLARGAELISVADVVEAVDGPIALTTCLDESDDCGIEALCPARANWQRVNDAIRDALKRVSLAEMRQGIPSAFLLPEERQPLAEA